MTTAAVQKEESLSRADFQDYAKEKGRLVMVKKSSKIHGPKNL